MSIPTSRLAIHALPMAISASTSADRGIAEHELALASGEVEVSEGEDERAMRALIIDSGEAAVVQREVERSRREPDLTNGTASPVSPMDGGDTRARTSS